MTVTKIDQPTRRKPLRLWPGVLAVVLLLLARFGLKLVVPGFKGFVYGMMGSFACAVAIIVWWLFFSRAAWIERLGAMGLMIVGLLATARISHESMGIPWLFGYAVPVLLLAFVAWAVASRRLADRPRRVTLVATILLACGLWTFIRSPGIDGDHNLAFAWRWSETAEERVLDQDAAGARALSPRTAKEATGEETAEDTAADWPGFRGPGRDGIVRAVRIATNWSETPPVELWRRPVGPGWSSFAVQGDLLYTQEQRGDDEAVVSYHTATGEPVWIHRDAVRFFETNAGAGPRATPTLSGGRVYTLGATGILNALDAGDGAVLWSRNVASDTGTEIPDWGFSSSPWVTAGVVIVAVGGRLAGYEVVTGEPRWTGPKKGASYSSPHLMTIDGVRQVLLLSGAGITSVTPTDGTVLWEHSLPGFPMVQPALTADGELLVSVSGETGTHRIAVRQGLGGWTLEERWASIGLKPYFNDFVVHKGHAYGFDGRILAAIDLADGERKWKGGRYGSGQLVLLGDQDVLLVLSEKGELALVRATPDRFTELARFPAIEGKTWNHPALAGDLLLVRNAEEMAAFRLPAVGG